MTRDGLVERTRSAQGRASAAKSHLTTYQEGYIYKAMDKQPIHPLSPREREVLRLLWDGLSLKEIASALNVSLARARGARLSIGQKLGVSNSWQLARKALAMKLIKLDG
jgi:DNA-binding NarL/FixJ family response regulator